MLYSRHRSEHHAQVNLVFKELAVVSQGGKHLHCALTVPYVSNASLASAAKYKVEKGRLIIVSKLLKAKIPVFGVHSGVKVGVVLAKPIASVVVHPHVVPLVSHYKSQRV